MTPGSHIEKRRLKGGKGPSEGGESPEARELEELDAEQASYLLVGVTGGIGSGKSTVCRAFGALGRLVVSADQVAREVTEQDPAVQAEIRKEFGDAVFGPGGAMDRAAVARLAFADKRKTAALNAIVHPRVFERIYDILAREPESRKRPYVIIEAALIFESGMDARLHRVIVVDAPEEVRIARVMARDHCTREEVLRRISRQMPAAEKLQLADFVIRNERNAVALDAKVAFVDMMLQALPPTDLDDEEA